MSKVEESVQALEKLCHCATALSIRAQGRTTSNWQLIEGSIIFGQNCLTCISVLRLIPISTFYRALEKLNAWDLPSVASLVRNIIEAYHVFFYITEHVPDAEREAREALWRFHETAEHLKALELGVPSSKKIELLKKEYLKRRARLEACSFFQGLPNKERTKFDRGSHSKFLNQYEIAERAGVSRKYLASCYKYCSNFTHISPMSVAMMNAFRAGTPEGRQRFKFVADVAAAFMSLTIRDFVRLAPDQREQIERNTWQIIRLWEGVLKSWELNSNAED